MVASRSICFFTGTRADYGLLAPLARAVARRPTLEVKFIVTGSHLSAGHGFTWREIVDDGFEIDERVEILQEGDTATSVSTAMGLAVSRVGDALNRLSPDLLVILGDRYEALAAASAAAIHAIPVAHLHGGEQTLGAVDEMFRHALTKLSHLHFTSTEAYRRRVIQLGEEPSRVFNVGAIGVANALNVPQHPRSEVLERLGLQPDNRFLLLTFHPATLDPVPPQEQIETLIEALEAFPELNLIFTGANADLGGRTLNEILLSFSSHNLSRVRFFDSLGARWYLNAARQAEAVVGNSSSGIIEVPSLGVPTVDIGSRQAGRIFASSVLKTSLDSDSIRVAVQRAISPEFRALARNTVNPYEQSDTVERMVNVIENADIPDLIHKRFYDLPPD